MVKLFSITDFSPQAKICIWNVFWVRQASEHWWTHLMNAHWHLLCAVHWRKVCVNIWTKMWQSGSLNDVRKRRWDSTENMTHENMVKQMGFAQERHTLGHQKIYPWYPTVCHDQNGFSCFFFSEFIQELYIKLFSPNSETHFLRPLHCHIRKLSLYRSLSESKVIRAGAHPLWPGFFHQGQRGV